MSHPAGGSRPPLRLLFSGGDRRPPARSGQALRLVHNAPQRVATLAPDEDWLVSMRALDMLEELAHSHPGWVAPYRRLLLGRLAESESWEVHLRIVRALPLFEWTPSEYERAVSILRRDLHHPRTLVRAWALDGLATFAMRDGSLRPMVEQALEEFERSRSRALSTRARLIRERLTGSG